MIPDVYRASSYPTASSRFAFDSLLQRPSVPGQRFVNGFFDRPYRSQNIAQTLVELVSVSLLINLAAVSTSTLCSVALSNTIDLNVREPFHGNFGDVSWTSLFDLKFQSRIRSIATTFFSSVFPSFKQTCKLYSTL